MDKYDKILSQLLLKFDSNSKIEEDVKRIVKGVIASELNKLDKGLAHGIKHEIRQLIDKEALLKSKEGK